MEDKYITLPDVFVVGGTSNEIVFNMLSNSYVPLDISDCDVNFSISNYTFFDAQPLISYSSDVDVDNISIVSEGSKIQVNISPYDTKYLSGKFMYQITIKNDSQEYVSFQGILYIRRNINPEFVNSEV